MDTIEKWIKIQSYKHDGGLHRFWRRSFILQNDEEWLVVASRRTQVVEGNGRRWYTKEPAVSFFSKKNWFNVIAMIKESGIVFYTNIASPTIIESGIAKYIDYDLDIKRYSDGGIRFLDKNEYERHIKHYDYSDDLVKIIDYKQKQIVAMITNKVFPFIDSEVIKLFDVFKHETEVKDK